jgi:hypothetical protein
MSNWERGDVGGGLLQLPEFDGFAPTGQYGNVRRLMLLAIGLSALLWTVAARPAPVPVHDIVSMSAAESCAMSADSPTPLDSDLQWRAEHDAIGPITESMWKSAPVHAALAATRTSHLFDTLFIVSAPDPPAANAPPYLRHTPLLI